MKIVFDLGTGRHLKPGLAENLYDPPETLGDGMQTSPTLAAARQRYVDRVAIQCRVEPLTFEALTAFIEDRFQALLGKIDFLADSRSLLGR